MKVLISILIGLLVVGCGNQEQTDANELTPTTKTNKVTGTTESPSKELTLREKVIGEYEIGALKWVFLDNGVAKAYFVGKKQEGANMWKVVDSEIHVDDVGEDGHTEVYRTNKDGSITYIAAISVDGQREDVPKEHQSTFKKIK